MLSQTVNRLSLGKHLQTFSRIARAFSSSSNEDFVNLVFVNKNNTETKVKAKVGKSILEIAHENTIDIEGACDASLSCSTCHIIFEEQVYAKLKPAASDEEDLLDLAYGLTATSRLGCQVKVDKSLDGARIALPRTLRAKEESRDNTPTVGAGGSGLKPAFQAPRTGAKLPRERTTREKERVSLEDRESEAYFIEQY